MKRLITAAILAITMLMGCAATPQSPAQAVYAVHGTYATALTVAVKYKQLPPCLRPAAPPLCAEPAVVARLQKADDVAYAALTVAQKVVRSPTEGPGAISAAIENANRAVQAFAQIANTLEVK